MPKRIDRLTSEQEARFDEWADRWIEVGLSTQSADRARFEEAARACYRYAGLAEPKVIVWCPNPLVAVMAGPIASYLLAVRGAVDGAVDDAVRGAVRGAVGGAVGGAVDGAVGDAVDGAVGDAVDGAVRGAVRGAWTRYLSGQFWIGGWWWGGAWTSYFREVAELELPGDLWDRARAYEATMESACWWWPHREFIMVSERPRVIQREQVGPRGWGSHRLHCDDGPAVAWDGWAIYAIHGVRVPEQVVMAPHTLTAAQISAEPNAEVRRVMIERFGMERYLAEAGATILHADTDGLGNPRRLLHLPLTDDEPIMVVEVTNSTPEPDGSLKRYTLRVDPDAYGGVRTCQQAIASTWRRADGSLVFADPGEYVLAAET